MEKEFALEESFQSLRRAYAALELARTYTMHPQVREEVLMAQKELLSALDCLKAIK